MKKTIVIILAALLIANLVSAEDDCWQDSAAYRDVAEMGDSAIDRVDAAITFLDWYQADIQSVVFVYPDGPDQELHVIAVVDLRGAYMAVEPRDCLFGYADTAQGAIEELWGGERMRVIQYFSTSDALMAIEYGELEGDEPPFSE